MRSTTIPTIATVLLLGAQTTAPSSLDEVASDMTGTHEARPAGVPDSYDWAAGPRVGHGNAPPADWRAFTAWGQVYEAAGGNPATNTRVQLRDIRAYVLSKRTGAWARVQDAVAVQGAAYRADFKDDESKPAEARREPDGTVSVRAGGGWNYHYWPPGRAAIDPADVAGVFTTVEARLILDDPAKPDDRAAARYVNGMGADYWRSADAPWRADWSNNGDVAIGRFKLVGPDWRRFSMHSMTEAALRANPPPFD